MKNYLFDKGTKILLLLLLLFATGMMKVAQAQSAWEQTQNYLFYLVYADYQVGEQIMPQRENQKFDAIRRNLLPTKEKQGTEYGLWGDPDPAYTTSGLIGLAKNETEGFQVFFREQEKVRNLRIDVSPFLNEQNEELQYEVFYEEFFYLTPQSGLNPPDSLAEALVPYNPSVVKPTSVGHNMVFYVELKSTKDQTPGEYTSIVTAYDGNEVIDTRTVIAKVWNFALPENHYAEVVMGLYNRNSGYPSTSSLFTLNGIPVSNGNVAPEYLDEAKRILNGYQNCLLEHGVSTYELPRWLMEDDPKAAELAMADPRRKVFEVPVHWSDLNGSSFNESAQSVINQYKDIVYDNVFLKDKAFFYPMDEPNWSNQEIVNRFNNVCAALSESWPGYHAVIPFASNYFETVERFEGKIDILCPNQGAFNAYRVSNVTAVEERLQDFKTRNHTWRYQGDGQCGGIYGYISAIAPSGTMRRILFWQQCAINSNGFLNWNCAYLPNNWVKKTLPAASGIQTGNGDGILLYPGTMFGQDAATPVVSLRLKQLAEGIDDYDYLSLALEFLGEDYVNARLRNVYWDTNNNPNNYLCYLINRLNSVYYPTSCRWMNNARHMIGEALSAANAEHDWGEWQTAVLPDETHNGLEIRTCHDCGAQESRETFLTNSSQEIAFTLGWNWFSPYVNISLEDLEAALLEALPGATSITIKSQTQNVSYNGNGWRGTLNALDVAQMYEIKVPSSCSITLTGVRLNPSYHPVTITANGNTWIGFPFDEGKSLQEAFGTTFPVNGDIVKSKDGSASFNGTVWRGVLETLEPGQGYIYKSNAQSDRIFTYP
jgi:hypothetical protein